MTARQKRIIGAVQPYLSEIYATAQRTLEQWPIGHTVQCYAPMRFEPFADMTTRIAIHVTRAPDGYKFRVHDPLFWHRKGHTEPKWRTLHP